MAEPSARTSLKTNDRRSTPHDPSKRIGMHVSLGPNTIQYKGGDCKTNQSLLAVNSLPTTRSRKSGSVLASAMSRKIAIFSIQARGSAFIASNGTHRI